MKIRLSETFFEALHISNEWNDSQSSRSFLCSPSFSSHTYWMPHSNQDLILPDFSASDRKKTYSPPQTSKTKRKMENKRGAHQGLVCFKSFCYSSILSSDSTPKKLIRRERVFWDEIMTVGFPGLGKPSLQVHFRTLQWLKRISMQTDRRTDGRADKTGPWYVLRLHRCKNA